MAWTKAPFVPAGRVSMNLAIAVTVFPIIFIGELPDKTMFASLVMSTRGRPASVWLGAAAAFTVHVIIAVTIGAALFHFVPHRALEGVVAGIFLIGAGLALREDSTSGSMRRAKKIWSRPRRAPIHDASPELRSS
jgi:putative Ca2+/H+ antiporter (TMEM165/GDT1 family)